MLYENFLRNYVINGVIDFNNFIAFLEKVELYDIVEDIEELCLDDKKVNVNRDSFIEFQLIRKISCLRIDSF